MSEERNKQISPPHENPTGKMYFCGLILYILLYLQYETQWEYGGAISWGLKMFAISVLALQTILTFPLYKKPIEKLVFILALMLTCIVGVNAGHIKGTNSLYDLLIVFLLVFGAKGVEFRKIVKIYWIVGGIYCFVTVCASLMGIIDNLADVANRDEDTIGAVDTYDSMSLGYGWSTNMANHVLFILLAYFYWVRRALKLKEILLYGLITSIVLYYTGSRLSTFCIIIMLLITFMYKTKYGKRFLTCRIVSFTLILCIPIFAYVSYYVTDAYDEADLTWMIVDTILSGRLSLGQEAFDRVGIPLWGQFYEMFSSARDDGVFYNYLDSSYIQSLVINGLIYTLFLIFAYIVICKRAYQRKDFFLLYSIFVAGGSAMIAQHFIEMYMNPFLIALFATHTVDNKIKK